MRALTRKLGRDLWHIKGQVLAISLVIAAGVAMFIMYLSVFDSLRETQSAYYRQHRFADVFGGLKRAPFWVADRIAAIPGVADVETRVVVDVTIAVDGLPEPATGRLISIPVPRRPVLNDVYLRRGRYLEPFAPDEVLVGEAFALAHRLESGDTVSAIINGRRRDLQIVGIALSPEYVYNIRPGELIPDDTRFGVFWMGREALATAFDMEGGFNDVSVTLQPGASAPAVIATLDRLLARYGGLGAIPRALQISHWYLDSEIESLQSVGLIIPVIFLAVAAFLLNIVLTRIIAVQREQIAALKALGYSNREVGWHYIEWSLAIATLGALLGLAGGAWLGSNMIALYNQYFRFPTLQYGLVPSVVAGGVLISFTAAVLGVLSAVRRAVRLPPAEAMRPQAPATYRISWVERAGLRQVLSPSVRMVLRNIQRQPTRSAMSIAGIAFSGAMLIVGLFSIDALDVLMDIQFRVAQRQDVTLTFVEPLSSRAFHEIGRLPGILTAEPVRAVPARLRVGHRSRQIAISGLPADATLHRVIDASNTQPVSLPPDGLVLTLKLADLLGVDRGERVSVEVLEGRRPQRSVVVAEVVEEYMGTSAYMDIGALRDLVREGGTLSGAQLQVDDAAFDSLYRRLKALPAIAGVNVKEAMLDNFKRTLAQNINIMIFFNVLFASIIAFGVVYNAARVSLSERSRELASLRVIGFTRAEISAILLGELSIVTLVAIPIGLALGYGLAALVVVAFNTELYRFPLVVTSRTYAASALTVLVAAVISGLVVRRKLDRLDLVEVLKSRD